MNLPFDVEAGLIGRSLLELGEGVVEHEEIDVLLDGIEEMEAVGLLGCAVEELVLDELHGVGVHIDLMRTARSEILLPDVLVLQLAELGRELLAEDQDLALVQLDLNPEGQVLVAGGSLHEVSKQPTSLATLQQLSKLLRIRPRQSRQLHLSFVYMLLCRVGLIQCAFQFQ